MNRVEFRAACAAFQRFSRDSENSYRLWHVPCIRDIRHVKEENADLECKEKST
jgi:hypothetical protein